ncbi:hypothetical protein JCM10914A_53710 [Paenibacillus sp. JCM 10914]|nr:hypothetical protein [Paenibacillus sp. JCM 10914]
MSNIDRFILTKLNNCEERTTRRNLLKLFLIRIERAQIEQERRLYEL